MALQEAQQVEQAIKKAERILIALPKEHTPDAVGSALALYLILQKIMGKPVDIVGDNFELPENLHFLPNSKVITPAIQHLQKFVITVDLKQAPLQELSYSTNEDKLEIFLTPEKGQYRSDDVKAQASSFKYDLIFTIGCPDFQALGELHAQSPEFFYDTTIVNIDHHSTNDQYGQINLTNPNAVATGEQIFRLLNTMDASLIDKDVATCILTGMISETKSFKTITVTPAALEIAGKLLETGADQDGIIKALYRSRSLSTLNLWGRVLARLKSENNNKLVWSLITENDFAESSATPAELPDVVDELISFVPGVETVVLLYQKANDVGGVLRVLKGNNALYLAKAYRPTGNRDLARFEIQSSTLVDAEKTILEEIRKQLGRSS